MTDTNPSETRKYPWEVDVAVLLLFFNRPETFRQVFEQVRKARPSRLFLYQDGPRDERDMAGIEACREIASHIDWECEVHRQYLEHNQGCDPSGFRSHKWAFSLADKVIVLEDDTVPSVSFFRFCKEMLDRYENDERVMMISGFNIDEVSTDVREDYFFTSVFSIWGWASWRRVADLWDSDYSFMKDEYHIRQLKALVSQRRYRPDILRMFKDHSMSGKEFFETISWAAMLLNCEPAALKAVQKVETGGKGGFLPSGRPTILFEHPRHTIEHIDYKKRLYRVFAWGHPCIKIMYSLEELWLNLRYGNFRNIAKAVVKRIKKWTGMFKYA